MNGMMKNQLGAACQFAHINFNVRGAERKNKKDKWDIGLSKYLVPRQQCLSFPAILF